MELCAEPDIGLPLELCARLEFIHRILYVSIEFNIIT